MVMAALRTLLTCGLLGLALRAHAEPERKTQVSLAEPGGLPSVAKADQAPRVKSFSIIEGTRTLTRWDLEYDELDQIRSLAIRWDKEPFGLHETLALGASRALRADYEPGRAPRLQLETKGAPPWLFSGYDLLEGGERSYVTLSAFEGPAGRTLPALECFDHDEVVPFIRSLGLPAKGTTLLLYDLHPDDEPYDPKAGALMIGNWVAALKAEGLVSTAVWAKPPHAYLKPDPAVTDAEASGLEKLAVPGDGVIVSVDQDALSSTMWPEPPKEIRRRAALLGALAGRLGERLKALNFARSAWSRRGSEEFTPRWTSTFILNALVSEHQRTLGKAVLRKIPGQSLDGRGQAP